MTTKFTAPRSLLAAAAVALFVSQQAKAAETCAAHPITTRGEAASFQWLAKTKARANWRSRVRATKSLGEAYASWTQAQAREELCDSSARGFVCTFTGTPCHR